MKLTTRLRSLLRHHFADERRAHRLLDASAQHALAQHVARSEATHRGEIRLCIEGALPAALAWAGTPPRERALQLFGELGVWDTEDNTGVLIYLLLPGHHVEIVADRGIERHAPPGFWAEVVAQLSRDLAADRVEAGLKSAVDAVGALLRQHYPAAPGAANPNELPDAPVLR